MASSSLSRLRGLFARTKISATSSTTATPHPKPTTEAQREPDSIVKNFKKACRSDNFRHRNVTAYFTTISRLAAAKQYSLIEEIIEHQKQYKDISNEVFTTRLITLYGKSGMFSHAKKLFDEMPNLNCERTLKSFNTLLAACVNCKEYDKISDIFANVPEKLAIKPDSVSYTTYVKGICEMGSLDSAFSVIEEMEKNGLMPYEVTYNTLLQAFYRSDRFSDAEKVWEMMRERNVVPKPRTYNPKLRFFVDGDRIPEAVELIEEMRREGVEPDSFNYNLLIKYFCDGENLEEAKKWFGEMTKNECKPDRVSYGMVGYLACKMGEFDYAFELCKKAISEKLVIHKTLAQLVVDGLVKESKMKEAKELVELGNSNSYYTYNLKLPQTE